MLPSIAVEGAEIRSHKETSAAVESICLERRTIVPWVLLLLRGGGGGSPTRCTVLRGRL
jgi:hypothetical protein